MYCVTPTGVPLGPVPNPRGHREGLAILFDYNSTSQYSVVFEVYSAPVILKAFGLRVGESLSVFLVPDFPDVPEEIFLLNGSPIVLTDTDNAAIVSTVGRYRLFFVGVLGQLYVTAEKQAVRASGGGGGVEEVVAGAGIAVDSSTATAPIVSLASTTLSKLALAESALQPGDNVSELVNDAGYTANTGTVTSVGITTPTGLQASNSPIVGSGNIVLSYSAGYVGYTGVEQTKLADIEAGAEVNTVLSVNGQVGEIDLDAVSVGAEPAFSKGDIEAGVGITITGANTGRLFGAGDILISLDGTPGTGDVVGPASSTADAIALFDGATGKLLKDSALTIPKLRLIPQNSQSAAYTLVAADVGKHIFHPSADTTARVFTIPSNASVPFDIGTAITFLNQNGAGVITIAINADTLRLSPDGTTGSRTLAANGMATAIKVTATEWMISGVGLT